MSKKEQDKKQIPVGQESNQAVQEAIDAIKVRQKMRIYAFKNPDVPGYVKVGDTERGINTRLNEWKDVYGQDKVNKIFPENDNESIAMVGDIYFHDKSLHKYLMEKGHDNLSKEDFNKTKAGKDKKHYSNEFFKENGSEKDFIKDIKDGIQDIKDSYNTDRDKYNYYKQSGEKAELHYLNNQKWELRPNQAEVVENFIDKVNKGQTKLLLYAVMRFGKSYTAMMCAKRKQYKKVLILSAKADVVDEWKKTVELPEDFANYKFIKDSDLVNNPNIIKDVLKGNWEDEDTKLTKDSIVCFLTLQNLSGKQVIEDKEGKEIAYPIKDKLKPVFDTQWDLVLVDETHFGAWAGTYGKPISDEEDGQVVNEAIKANKEMKDVLEGAKIKRNITLHLSGTPYNLLYQHEFTDENTICKVQFEDILEDKERWDKDPENIDKEEWENPLFGFPTMLRFGFNLPKEAHDKLKKLKENNISYSLNDLFITTKNRDAEKYRSKNGKIRTRRKRISKMVDVDFIHEEEVLKLLKCIDGTSKDERILSFLDIPKIRDNEVCKHIVMVLPYKYSCDAMEQLLEENRKKFKNLKNYQVINIAGWSCTQDNRCLTLDQIKKKIHEAEENNKKTISLTVNRMLTGVTIPEWDTIFMMKETHSPQEYDQAIFRVQSPYVLKKESDDGDVIKIDMKPQTILVDFSPNRMFEVLAKTIESTNYIDDTDKTIDNNTKRTDRIKRILKYTNFIAFNSNEKGMVKIVPTNILDILTQYNTNESIMDSMEKLLIDDDFNIEDKEFLKFIDSLPEFELHKSDMLSSKQIYKNDKGDLSDVKFDAVKMDINNKEKGKQKPTTDNKKENRLSQENRKKLKSLMLNLLVYSFLTNSDIECINDIVESLDIKCKVKDNRRIAEHLGLESIKNIQLLDEVLTGYEIKDRFEYQLRNMNRLSKDESITESTRLTAVFKTFSRLGSDIVVTPCCVCEKVVAGKNMIPKADYIKAINNGEVILDIASKIGEFSKFIWNYLKDDFKGKEDKLKKAICCIPLNGMTYELTRKTYELLGLNVDNIATFTAYDLLRIKPEKIQEFFNKQTCKFCEIQIPKDGEYVNE